MLSISVSNFFGNDPTVSDSAGSVDYLARNQSCIIEMR